MVYLNLKLRLCFLFHFNESWSASFASSALFLNYKLKDKYLDSYALPCKRIHTPFVFCYLITCWQMEAGFVQEQHVLNAIPRLGPVSQSLVLKIGGLGNQSIMLPPPCITVEMVFLDEMCEFKMTVMVKVYICVLNIYIFFVVIVLILLYVIELWGTWVKFVVSLCCVKKRTSTFLHMFGESPTCFLASVCHVLVFFSINIKITHFLVLCVTKCQHNAHLWR